MTRWLSIAIVATLGCSHSKTGAPDSGPSVDAGLCTGATGSVDSQTWCNDFANAQCAWGVRCQALDQGWSSLCAEAIAEPLSACNQDLINQGRYTVPPGAACCLQVLSAAGCTGWDYVNVRNACGSAMVAPNVPLGGACDQWAECIPGDDAGQTGCYRGWSETSCAGVCSLGVQVGQWCSSFPGYYCIGGWCDFPAGQGHGNCRSFTAEGTGCSSSLECGPQAYCGSAGVCTARGSIGAACAGDACAVGAHCFNGTCAADEPLGAACDASDTQACSTLAQCLSGRCAPLFANPGDPCNSAIECTNSACSVDAGSGVCVPTPGLGDACSEACINSYTCVGGRCVAKHGRGAPCQQPPDCEEGLTCNPEVGTCQPLPLSGSCSETQGCPIGFCDLDAGSCVSFHAPFTPCTSDSQCANVSDADTCGMQDDAGVGVCDVCDPF